MKGWQRLFLAAGLLWVLLCLSALAGTGDVFMNDRFTVPGDGVERVYTFTPTANNLYTIRSFGEGSAQAELYLMGEAEPVAAAEGFSMEVRLIADATYRLRVRARGGDVEVEMMRSALGRSIDRPLVLKDLKGYDKVIARAYDTHWYSFTAPESGLYTIRSQSAINTVGYLLDQAGNKLAMSDNLYSPYCLDFRIVHRLEKDRTYILRVSGRGGTTGRYRLIISSPEAGQPLAAEIVPDRADLILTEGESAKLSFVLKPEGAFGDVVWLSTDDRVAAVDQEGKVTALSSGTARIIMSGLNGVQGVSSLTVEPVPVAGIQVEKEAYSLYPGDTLTIPWKPVPENASDRRVQLESSDEAVVQVEQGDLLVAVGQGECTVTLRTLDGGFTQAVQITVLAPKSRYRALILGIQRFEDGQFRLGAVNTTQGVFDLFSRQDYDGLKAEVKMELDVTRSRAIAAIREAFRRADTGDVSILYLNSHGGVSDRNAWVKFADGEKITAAQLEKELRKIPGRVVVLLDCCQSGSFLSTRARRGFGGRFVQAFASGSAGRLISSKYCILTSTSALQDSYRLLPVSDAAEGSSSTAFARSLCEAGGWDLIGDKGTRHRADLDQDRRVSLWEAYLYTHSRVRRFLKGQKADQDVQLWPKGCGITLFAH